MPLEVWTRYQYPTHLNFWVDILKQREARHLNLLIFQYLRVKMQKTRMLLLLCGLVGLNRWDTMMAHQEKSRGMETIV